MIHNTYKILISYIQCDQWWSIWYYLQLLNKKFMKDRSIWSVILMLNTNYNMMRNMMETPYKPLKAFRLVPPGNKFWMVWLLKKKHDKTKQYITIHNETGLKGVTLTGTSKLRRENKDGWWTAFEIRKKSLSSTGWPSHTFWSSVRNLGHPYFCKNVTSACWSKVTWLNLSKWGYLSDDLLIDFGHPAEISVDRMTVISNAGDEWINIAVKRLA